MVFWSKGCLIGGKKQSFGSVELQAACARNVLGDWDRSIPWRYAQAANPQNKGITPSAVSPISVPIAPLLGPPRAVRFLRYCCSTVYLPLVWTRLRVSIDPPCFREITDIQR